ncbi:hypothetical protein, partial [Umezakia ovalisporum]|uniref:hypothetical protein n=1 Tax=Umezakia ovalisporum TaxID=75695 RepID=UPI0039C6D715
MFAKDVNFNLTERLVSIRNSIKNDPYSFELFKSLYEFANSAEPGICDNFAYDKHDNSKNC